jgi:hypothetical protein
MRTIGSVEQSLCSRSYIAFAMQKQVANLLAKLSATWLKRANN